jgi:hypothetical protein
LIANRASTGDPNAADQATSGGNVFEIVPGNTGASPTWSTLVGNRIYGMPTNSGNLVQPSFAMRPY